MKCSYCNTENDATSKFCFNCGSKLEQEVVVENTSTQVKLEKKEGNKGGLVFITVIVLLLILAVCGLIMNLSSPKNVYRVALKKSSSLLANTINDYDTSYINLLVTPKVEKAEEEAIDVINKFSFAFTTKMDNVNKAFDYNAVIKYNNNDLLNITTTYKDSLYITLNELLSKSIKVDVDEIEDLFTTKEFNDDLQYIYKTFIKTLTSSLRNDYFTKDKETLFINGKDVKVTANTLNLNSNNVKVLLSDVKGKLLKDKKFISTLVELSGEDESEIKKNLEELDTIDNEEISGNMVIYTTGLTNKVVRVKLYTEEGIFLITPQEENKYEVSIETEEVKILFNLEYTYEYNKDLNISVPTNSMSIDEIEYTDILDVLENLEKNQAYKELTTDIGVDLEDLMSLFMN